MSAELGKHVEAGRKLGRSLKKNPNYETYTLLNNVNNFSRNLRVRKKCDPSPSSVPMQCFQLSEVSDDVA